MPKQGSMELALKKPGEHGDAHSDALKVIVELWTRVSLLQESNFEDDAWLWRLAELASCSEQSTVHSGAAGAVQRMLGRLQNVSWRASGILGKCLGVCSAEGRRHHYRYFF